MSIEQMLDMYRPIERVSSISSMKREKEPEIQKSALHRFDYVLKQEELEIKRGNAVYEDKNGVCRKIK